MTSIASMLEAPGGSCIVARRGRKFTREEVGAVTWPARESPSDSIFNKRAPLRLHVSGLQGACLTWQLRRSQVAHTLSLVLLARRLGRHAGKEEERNSWHPLERNSWHPHQSPSRSGAMAAIFEAEGSRPTELPSSPRVAVIGGGLAGLAASVEILRHGGKVVILEKCDRLGGNSAKASSGINAALSAPQRALGLDDSLPEFEQDTLKSGKGLANEELVEVLVANSAAAVDFLQDFQINLSSIARLGGHSHARTHRASFDGKAMNVGYRIMSALWRYLEDQPTDKVEVVKKARATELLLTGEGGQVRGVRCQVAVRKEDDQELFVTRDILVTGVVLATGGFCSDRKGLLSKYVPRLQNLATTNGPFATGDGARLAFHVGAALVDMDQVQLHPTAFVDPREATCPTKFLAPEALRGCGGILLNQKGERFVNELATRDEVVAGILANCEPLPPTAVTSSSRIETASPPPVVAYLLLNTAGIEAFDKTTADFYTSKGLIRKFANAGEMCRALSFPEDAVRRTLEDYGQVSKDLPVEDSQRQEGMHLPSADTPLVQHDVHDSFGKPTFPSLFSADEELYVAMVTPALHYCMGGLRFDSHGRILREDGSPIHGLYGAGEVTGGVHGGNRLAGNSLLECVVFGRIAGQQAWEYVQHVGQYGERGCSV